MAPHPHPPELAVQNRLDIIRRSGLREWKASNDPHPLLRLPLFIEGQIIAIFMCVSSTIAVKDGLAICLKARAILEFQLMDLWCSQIL